MIWDAWEPCLLLRSVQPGDRRWSATNILATIALNLQCFTATVLIKT